MTFDARERARGDQTSVGGGSRPRCGRRADRPREQRRGDAADADIPRSRSAIDPSTIERRRARGPGPPPALLRRRTLAEDRARPPPLRRGVDLRETRRRRRVARRRRGRRAPLRHRGCGGGDGAGRPRALPRGAGQLHRRVVARARRLGHGAGLRRLRRRGRERRGSGRGRGRDARGPSGSWRLWDVPRGTRRGAAAGYSVATNRGAAAAASWICRGGRVAAPPSWICRGGRVAAPPRPSRRRPTLRRNENGKTSAGASAGPSRA